MSEHTSARADGPAAFPVRVLRLKKDQQVRCVALQDAISGLVTHWVDGRNESCRGPICPKKWHTGETGWRGYFAALAYNPGEQRWEPVAVEVTMGLEQFMRPQFRRGTVWHLSKGPPVRGRNPGLRAQLHGAHVFAELPEAFDILPAVRLLFQDAELTLDVPNPLPPRTFVELPELPPPAGPEASSEAGPMGPRLSLLEESRRRAARRNAGNGDGQG